MTFLKSWAFAAALAVMAIAGPHNGPAFAEETVSTTHGLTLATAGTRRAGHTIRANNLRTVSYTQTWLQSGRYLRTRPVGFSQPRGVWWPTPYYRGGLFYIGSGLYTRRPHPRYDYACRFLADCPCRFLAGC